MPTFEERYEAHSDGKDAYRAGLSEDANPFQPATWEFNSWRDGYRAEKHYETERALDREYGPDVVFLDFVRRLPPVYNPPLWFFRGVS